MQCKGITHFVYQAVQEHPLYSSKNNVLASGGVARGGIQISITPSPSGGQKVSNEVLYTSVCQAGKEHN